MGLTPRKRCLGLQPINGYAGSTKAVYSSELIKTKTQEKKFRNVKIKGYCKTATFCLGGEKFNGLSNTLLDKTLSYYTNIKIFPKGLEKLY